MELHFPQSATIPFSRPSHESTVLNGRIAFRLFGYFVLIGLLFAGTVKLAAQIGPGAVVSEGCVVESLQLTALILIGAGCFVLAAWSAADRAIYALLTIAAVFVIERELNYHLVLRETWACVIKHSAQVLLIGGTLILARHTIGHQFRRLMTRPAFLLLLAGFALVTIWAQVLGQGTVWTVIQPENQLGKRYVEEHLELAGYSLILAAIVEEGLYFLRCRRAERSRAPLSEDVSSIELGVDSAWNSRNPCESDTPWKIAG